MTRQPVTDAFGQRCPCGSGVGYQVCCAPLHHGAQQAATAVQLMRSRYSAFARGEADYLFRTWHPRTRPAELTVDADVVWTRLDVTDTVGGEFEDAEGEVEFAAHFNTAGRPGVMRERSRFERRAGRWLYVDGDAR